MFLGAFFCFFYRIALIYFKFGPLGFWKIWNSKKMWQFVLFFKVSIRAISKDEITVPANGIRWPSAIHCKMLLDTETEKGVYR